MKEITMGPEHYYEVIVKGVAMYIVSRLLDRAAVIAFDPWKGSTGR